MKNWFSHIIKGNSYQGLEIFEIGGEVRYALLKILRKKDELYVKFEETFDSIADLAPNIQRNTILFLSVNTSQILTKSVDGKTELNPEQLIMTAFPNLDLDSFYYETMDGLENRQVSICKRDYLSSLMEELARSGITLAQIALGTSPIQNIQGYLNESEVIGSNYQLSANGSIEPIAKSSGVINQVGGMSLKSFSLTSFAQILGHIQAQPHFGNLNGKNAFLLNDFKNGRLFHIGLRTSLGIFLTILLVNFLFYSSYRNELQDIGAPVTEQQQTNLLNTLRERVTLKEEKLAAVTNSINSKASFYLDRIAHEIPTTILLDGFIYQPHAKQIAKGKAIELEEYVMLIAGVAHNKSEFTQWTSGLEHKPWVERVEIDSYEYLTKGKDQFTLKVYLDEAE
nr:hypothetical protein [Allomuricauda sp.]